MTPVASSLTTVTFLALWLAPILISVTDARWTRTLVDQA